MAEGTIEPEFDLQPMPTGDGAEVFDRAQQTFEHLLSERTKRGIATYGTPLKTHNGRDAFRDCLEEIVDAWQYLVQARMESDDLQKEVRRLQRENRGLLRQVNELKCAEAMRSASPFVGIDPEKLVHLYRPDGKLTGSIYGKVLWKKADITKSHQLYKPPAWAISEEHYQMAREMGVEEVHIYEVSQDILWKATMKQFEDLGFGLKRGGFEFQRGLELHHWTQVAHPYK